MNATQYEVINKVTEEVLPVTRGEAGNETVTWHLEDGTPIVFSNIGNVGDLQNDTYTIREVGTHSKPDGTGTVEVTEAGIVDSEAVVTEEVVAENVDTTADADVVAETETVAEASVETAPTE